MNIPPSLLRLLAPLLAVLLLAGCSVESKKARLLESANRSYRAGELEKAKIEVLNLLSLDARDPKANELLGSIWSDQGAPHRAGFYLQQALAARPSDNQVAVKVAQSLLAIGEITSARRQALEVLKRSPGQADALLVLSAAARTPSDFTAVEKEVRGSTALTTVAYRLASANLSLFKGDIPGARRLLLQAVSLNPNSPEAHAALAMFYQAQHNTSEARKESAAAVKLAPPRSSIHLDSAELHVQAGLVNEAFTHLTELSRKAPDYLPVWIGLARIALIQKKPDEAIAALQKVIAVDPDNYDARTLRAEVGLAKGETVKAIEDLQTIGREYAGLSRDKFLLGRAYLQSGRVTEATEALTRAIANQPDHIEAVLLKGKIDLQAGRTGQVVSAMTGLLYIRPKVAEAQTMLITALRAQGQLDDAVQAIRAQIRFFPESAQPHYLLGLVLVEQKKVAEARASFEQALTLDPEFLPAATRLVELDVLQRNFGPALNRAQAQLEAAPDSAPALHLMARVQAAQGKWTEANGLLRKAIESDPNHAASYGLLVSGMMVNQQLPQAAQEMETLRAKSPDNQPVLMLSGVIYAQLNQADKARDAYEKLLSLQPNSSIALNNLACVYADQLNQLDRGLEMARRARDLEPTSAPIADTLGWIQFRRKEYAVALELLKEAAAALPNDPEVQYHFGMASQQAGQTEAARAAFQFAARSAGDFPGKAGISSQPAMIGVTP